ncbi:MAG: tetratricopeptide repeat protein [Rhizomicrobium sp.]
MSSRIAFAATIGLCLAGGCLTAYSACAQDATATPAPAADPQPWQKDQALMKTAWADIQSGGILAVAPHVPDLEQPLANAKQTIDSAASSSGTRYVLTDGPADTLMTLLLAATDKTGNGQHVVAVQDPYPNISFYLGSYYNEIGKFDDAVRVLDEGLALAGVQGLGTGIGASQPILVSEKGAALAGLKRWPDALAAYDSALKIDGLDDAMRAHLLRGRGYALTELNRLDEAEQAYNDSLKYEPGNARAQSELQYISGLRTGARPVAPGGLVPVQPQSIPTTTAVPATSTATTPPVTTTTPASPPSPSPTPN